MNWRYRIYDAISLLIHGLLGTLFLIFVAVIMVLISIFIGVSF